MLVLSPIVVFHETLPRKKMKNSFWKWLLCITVFVFGAAHADEAEIAGAVKHLFGMQATSVRESLIPGLFAVNTSPAEVGPRFFMDRQLTRYGNYSTGYSHIAGPRRGQDLNTQESQELFRSMLAALPKERLITLRFGDGFRQVLLFTAYDCPTCRSIERTLQQQSNRLNTTVYLIPTALRYETDQSARTPVQNVLCAADREAAWRSLILKGQTPAAPRCAENADDYAYLYRAFPVRFPRSVPTAVTLADGKIYQGVQQQFSEIFAGR